LTRIRLRDARTAEAERAYYAGVYPGGYRHDLWPDHVERVAASIELIRQYKNQVRTAADLSCGDGAIIRGLDLDTAYLGDLNGLPEWPRQAGKSWIRPLPPGPLPDSLGNLPEPVDLFVLSETLEHMDDPDDLLRQIRMFSRYLFLSTPINEVETSGNLEHYWSWGTNDLHQMLMDAGWTPLELRWLVPESTRTLEHAYHYQLWMAVAR
jgi:hypothetical protein